jgi:hypothetical protein
VADAGKSITRILHPRGTFEGESSLDQFYGWYDLIITVTGDPIFEYRLAGHVENGADSISDPALGGLVTLKGRSEPGKSHFRYERTQSMMRMSGGRHQARRLFVRGRDVRRYAPTV